MDQVNLLLLSLVVTYIVVGIVYFVKAELSGGDSRIRPRMR
jgi:VIT1/CCC1 family predicted Fe2+/Mn2+ transporter